MGKIFFVKDKIFLLLFGRGIKNIVDLIEVVKLIDNVIFLRIFRYDIFVFIIFFIIVFCFFVIWFRKIKLG